MMWGRMLPVGTAPAAGFRREDLVIRYVLALPLLLVALGAPAPGGETTYDDRAVIRRGLAAAAAVRKAFPAAGVSESDPRAFAKRDLVGAMRELEGVQRSLGYALRRKGDPKQVVSHRRAIRDLVRKFISAFRSYGTLYGSVATARRQLTRMERVKPTEASS